MLFFYQTRKNKENGHRVEGDLSNIENNRWLIIFCSNQYFTPGRDVPLATLISHDQLLSAGHFN